MATTPQCILLLAMAALDLPAQRAITVVLDDRASLGQRDLVDVERVTTRLLVRAGIAVRWNLRRIDDTAALRSSSYPRARNSADAPEIAALILLGAPSSFDHRTLAYSLPSARAGAQVVLYLDRAKKVAEGQIISTSLAIGAILAHEIGHVLLQSSTHSSTGLMRARWDKGDWLLARALLLDFTPPDRERLNSMLIPLGH